MRRMPFQRLPARVHHYQLAAAFCELLEIGRGDRVVLNRVGADDDGNIGMFDLVKVAVTAPEPTFSIKAATDDAWQSRVQ